MYVCVDDVVMTIAIVVFFQNNISTTIDTLASVGAAMTVFYLK